MYTKVKSSWIKHIDFLMLDSIGIVITFLFTLYLRMGVFNINAPLYQGYKILIALSLVSNICIAIMYRTCSGILKRGYLQELKKVVIHNFLLLSLLIIYLFVMQTGSNFSRIVVCSFAAINAIFMYIIHIVYKKILHKIKKRSTNTRKMLLVCSNDIAEETVQKITTGIDSTYEIIGICLEKNKHDMVKEISEIPIVSFGEDMYDFACSNVVDTVVINAKMEKKELRKVVERFLAMGIVVNININNVIEDIENVSINRINEAIVITNSINQVGLQDVIFKRTIDILAGIVGTILTGIIFIFVAPAIKIADPKGPVFFKQKRVGKNGRMFNMYKFRSMYSDAEDRKAELMKNNKMDGNMFKIDADPRIIGSGKDGTKKGLGHFIRATSLDEFPNFFSILSGSMSLVGTRPPTVDEYEKYEHHHKSRLAIKPGLTGLWQVSGRSDITDFEEIVKLDNKYIRNWSFVGDIKIVLRTILVVFTHKGSV